MASTQTPPTRPRPGYATNPNPNINSLAGSVQNMQIGNRPSQPPQAYVGGSPPPPNNLIGPPGPIGRPGPPPPHSSTRPVGAPAGFVAGRPSPGPMAPGSMANNGPMFTSPPGGPGPFRGNPPQTTPATLGNQGPFSGGPVPQPMNGPGASQTPFSAAPMTQPALSGGPLASHPPPSYQPPLVGRSLPARPAFPGAPPPSSQPPFPGAPQPSSRPPMMGAPPTSQSPFMTPQSSQPPIAPTLPSSQPPFIGGQPGQAMFRQPFPGGPPSSQLPYGAGTGPAMQNPSFPGAPPSSQPFNQMAQPPNQQFPGSQMLRGPPGSGVSHGSQPWSSQATQPLSQGMPGMPSTMAPPPPRMYGMATQAPVSPMMGHSPGSTPSKIDPSQVPRPVPSTSPVIFETRIGGQASIPPPATSDFIVRDTGNCSPRYMRSTINQIPCTGDLLSTSSLQLSLLVQPFALPHPSEEPIQVVDFGESGPLRCSRCKGYINPFMKFIEQGRRFVCNLCGFVDQTPRDYLCNLGPDGRRRDADERPELCRGTVEFVATKEYMVRDPMPAVFFFLIDVSMNAVQTGATAAACSAISQAIADLPEGPRTRVGVATYDSTIHFYNLKRTLQQPLMLIVPDVQDVYTPLHTDIVVQLPECRQPLEQLLENIPNMFENTKITESALCAAMKACSLAMKPTGGKLLVFQSVLPSVGIGSLSSREAEGRTNISTGEKEAHKLLQPADKSLKTMAIEFAEYQVCVDIFISSQTYVDVASISVIPRTTGGQVYYYYPFSALSDSAKLYNDLRWNVTRPQGFEAVMRVRCTQGLQVQDYFGNFCKRIPTDIDLPGIDSDKTIMVTFKHDDKFQEGSECAFQCAILYTTVYGQRRIRVSNLSLPCTSMLSNLFRSADLDSHFATFLKRAANDIPTKPLSHVREQVTNLCINTLHAYRKYCATVSSTGQLILPETLKLLPLYTLALTKSVGLLADGRFDDRSYWINRAFILSTALCVPLVYPRMIAIQDLASMEDGMLIPPVLSLSSEQVTDDGIYFLENGEDALVYVGNTVETDVLQKLFGASSIDAIPSQFVLKQYDNELSKKLNEMVSEIQRQRCSYLRLRLCKRDDPSGILFFSYMIEDKTPSGLSYLDFLVRLHRQIQTKMA